MSAEFVKFIPEIEKLGLNKFPTDDQLGHVEQMFGEGFLEAPTIAEQRFTHFYLNSGVKQAIERPLGIVLNMTLAKRGRNWASQISQMHGGDGYYLQETGFSADQMFKITKIQTMTDGAHDSLESPFGHTTFTNSNKTDCDPRIFDSELAHWLRGWRDEIPQLPLIAKGEMFFIGIRSFTDKELEGNNIILWLSKHSDLIDFDEGVGDIYGNFIKLTGQNNMRPALIGVHSALEPAVVSNSIRLLVNNQYLEGKASPLTDMRVFYYVLKKRILRGESGEVTGQSEP